MNVQSKLPEVTSNLYYGYFTKKVSKNAINPFKNQHQHLCGAERVFGPTEIVLFLS